MLFFLYLPVNPAGVHPSGECLDGDDSLSHSKIGPSISHHTILFLTDEGSSSETQEISISEEVVRGKEGAEIRIQSHSWIKKICLYVFYTDDRMCDR